VPAQKGRPLGAPYVDRALRTVKGYQEKVEYIHLNPARAILVKHPDEWKWSSSHERGCAGTGTALWFEDRWRAPLTSRHESEGKAAESLEDETLRCRREASSSSIISGYSESTKFLILGRRLTLPRKMRSVRRRRRTWDTPSACYGFGRSPKAHGQKGPPRRDRGYPLVSAAWGIAVRSAASWRWTEPNRRAGAG
jgi:hypothetical protein